MLSAHMRARVPLVPTCELQVKAHNRNGGACVWTGGREGEGGGRQRGFGRKVGEAEWGQGSWMR